MILCVCVHFAIAVDKAIWQDDMNIGDEIVSHRLINQCILDVKNRLVYLLLGNHTCKDQNTLIEQSLHIFYRKIKQAMSSLLCQVCLHIYSGNSLSQTLLGTLKVGVLYSRVYTVLAWDLAVLFHYIILAVYLLHEMLFYVT